MNAPFRLPASPPVAPNSRSSRSEASASILSGAGASQPRAKLAARLRRVLAAHPNARHFTVNRIVATLGAEAAPSLALFSAAGLFEAPDIHDLSGQAASAIGAGLATGRRAVALPRSLLRRRIPRNSLALLIHGVAALLDKADGLLRERWSWVFHPAMSVALGLTLFLLGLAAMAPIIGGGAQYAASAFLVALGQAERDGLAVMIGAVAGLASLAVAALSVSTGRKLWIKIKSWLVRCARRLRLHVLCILLDRCCEGLGALAQMSWTEILLLLLSPDTAPPRGARRSGAPESALRLRARRARMAAARGRSAVGM